MATYTAYWPEQMCEGAIEAGLEGRPVAALFGGPMREPAYTRWKWPGPGPGDVVVVIACRGGILHALCSLEVTERSRWRTGHPAARYHWGRCGGHGVLGRPLAPLRFDRPLSPAQQLVWRFAPGDGRRLLGYLDERGRVQASSAVGVHEVSAETATMLQEVLQPPLEPNAATAEVLETRLSAQPYDEATARVLADAWQAEGDPRGELLSLELALRQELNVESAAAIDARISELVRRVPRLKRLSGGFPLRPTWGSRPLVELHALVRFGSMSPARALAFAQQYVAADSFHHVVQSGGQSAFAFERLIQELGADDGTAWDAVDTTWVKSGGFSPGVLEELMEKIPREAVFEARVEGPAVVPGSRSPLPLQGGALWGSYPARSTVSFWFDQSAATYARLTLWAPTGPALANVAITRWTEEFQRASGRVMRRPLQCRRWPELYAERPARERYGDPSDSLLFRAREESTRWVDPVPI